MMIYQIKIVVMKKNKLYIIALLIGLALTNANAQSGEELFNDNCTACHKLGAKLVGPNLEGVTERRSEDWIKSFINNSKALIESGDKDAKAIFEEYNKTEMTAFQGSFSDDEMNALIDYLKTAKAPKPTITVSSEGNGVINQVEAPKTPEQIIGNALTYTFAIIIVVLLLMVMSNVSAYLNKNMTEEELNSSFSSKFFAMFAGDWRLFTGNYTESSTEGHEYDGIRELDNTMPPWLQGIFYITILFAIGYLVNYHIINPENTQLKEYQNEMIAATEKYGDMDVVKIPIVQVEDKSRLASAHEGFVSKCAACHLEDGGGSVGPNLTDEYWINGGSLENIFYTIRNGVPEKGMISWKGQLTDDEMLDLASYIKNLQGTTPTKAKAPQGEKYVD